MNAPFTRTLHVLILALLLLPALALARENPLDDPGKRNLLNNPGFEKGGSQPKAWTPHPGSPSGISYIWDSVCSHNGIRSVSIRSTSGTPAMWRQTVPVKEGTLYTLSGYVKLRRVKDNGFCTIEVVFLDHAGNRLGNEHLLEHHGTIGWLLDIPHEKKFRAPPAAASAEINLLLKSEGRVWFDDIFFGRTPLGSVEGTVVNGAAPVEGARVHVWGTELEAQTDVDGRYRIDGIPVESPRYVLIASKDRFRSLPAGNVAVVPHDPSRVDFVLRPGPEPAVTELRVKCGRIAWHDSVEPSSVDPLALIVPSHYPPETAPYLKNHRHIDSNDPLVQATAMEILESLDPVDRKKTLAVSHAVYEWIVRSVEWDGVYGSSGYTDVTSGAWQTISGEGWCNGHSFAEWLYKPSEAIEQQRGICIEHGRLAAALLRALDIPARPIQPYGTQFWVQAPGVKGYWATMSTSGGRAAYKTSGDLWASYAATPDSSIVGFPVDSGGWIHSDWFSERRGLWREVHPWSAGYPNKQGGFDKAVADLQHFAATGQAPEPPPPPPGPRYTIHYSDFTLDLRKMAGQRIVVARFPLPVETDVVFDMDEFAWWTDQPGCVTRTWVETFSHPDVLEENCWLNIEFDLTSLLPPPEAQVCNLKANGHDRHLFLNQGKNMRVRLSLDPSPLGPGPRDWWITADTPKGWYSWMPDGSWKEGIHRRHDGELVPVNGLIIVDTSWMTPGDYAFYFAVDKLDNKPVGNHFDLVKVTIL